MKCWQKDELIVEKERYAEVGDDLDFAFVDLIEGIEPIWSERRPKPPTPPPRPPSPPKPSPEEIAAAKAKEEAEAAAAAAAESGAAPGGEGAAAGGPPKEASPFELQVSMSRNVSHDPNQQIPEQQHIYTSIDTNTIYVIFPQHTLNTIEPNQKPMCRVKSFKNACS